MEKPKKRVPLKRRFVALILVVAGAICMLAGKPNTSGELNSLIVSGIGLMLAGIIIRLTGKRI